MCKSLSARPMSDLQKDALQQQFPAEMSLPLALPIFLRSRLTLTAPIPQESGVVALRGRRL
ncbi:hypothetical protein B1812_08425 [Methylocystis bryophila]|uniref:Uncharacterized protein n=1 Tax=Methylocystis bryophila TaxID=655015 RepID=A0A1W6MU61_9HYPH|nr:hypothetical protein B1812_08425 [Methylocystis bryophila]